MVGPVCKRMALLSSPPSFLLLSSDRHLWSTYHHLGKCPSLTEKREKPFSGQRKLLSSACLPHSVPDLYLEKEKLRGSNQTNVWERNKDTSHPQGLENEKLNREPYQFGTLELPPEPGKSFKIKLTFYFMILILCTIKNSYFMACLRKYFKCIKENQFILTP